MVGMPTKKNKFRMDFIQEIVEIDEKNRTFTARLIPNPARYEYKVLGGKKGYLDKFDNVFFPLDEIIKGMSKSNGRLPTYTSSPRIGNTDEYVKDRFDEIKSFFEQKPNDTEGPKDMSEELLEHLGEGKKTLLSCLSI